MHFVERVGRVFSSVSEFYKDINPSTLSGAIDILVIEDETGKLTCSPFHVRFGKLKLLRPQDKTVHITVNEKLVDIKEIPMKVSEAGDAYFVVKTTEPVPEDIRTSPLLASTPVTAKIAAELNAEAGQDNDAKQLSSASEESLIVLKDFSNLKFVDVVDSYFYLKEVLFPRPRHEKYSFLTKEMLKEFHASFLNTIDFSDSKVTIEVSRCAQTQVKNYVSLLSIFEENKIKFSLSDSKNYLSLADTVNMIYRIDSNIFISSKIFLPLLTNFILNKSLPIPFAETIELIQKHYSDEKLEKSLQSSSKVYFGGFKTWWAGASSPSKEVSSKSITAPAPPLNTKAASVVETSSQPNSAASMTDSPGTTSPVSILGPLPTISQPIQIVKQQQQPASSLLESPPSTSPIVSPPNSWTSASPLVDQLSSTPSKELLVRSNQQTQQQQKYNYAKTLRLSHDQLQLLNLKYGSNDITFTVVTNQILEQMQMQEESVSAEILEKSDIVTTGSDPVTTTSSTKAEFATSNTTTISTSSNTATSSIVNPSLPAATATRKSTAVCQARIWLWKYDVKIVISDIDGTITKSDALGHFFTMVGKDWTHTGVASLFTSIQNNGYNFLYLTSRAIGQANSTREYLKGIEQGIYQLPTGPVIMSPDRLLAAFKREMILKRPEEFKIACLKDILKLFNPLSTDDSLMHETSIINPFYAGFGNRITDAISYRAVGIPPHRIFTVNTTGELTLEQMLSNYTSSYSKISDLVDHIFPPLHQITHGNHPQEAYNNFHYWRSPIDEVIIVNLDEQVETPSTPVEEEHGQEEEEEQQQNEGIPFSETENQKEGAISDE